MPESDYDQYQRHCTCIAKYLSTVITILEGEASTDQIWKDMLPIVVQLNDTFKRITGFNSMGREAPELGYFSDRDILFKNECPEGGWQLLSIELVKVLEENLSTLKRLSTLSEHKSGFFASINNVRQVDIRNASTVFCEKLNSILTLLNESQATSIEGLRNKALS